MNIARTIREFFSILFGSRLVVQLRADLEEAKRERDYFRGQCERLQLLIGNRQPERVAPVHLLREHATPGNGGRKTFAQLQAENTQRMREEEEAERKANQEKKP